LLVHSRELAIVVVIILLAAAGSQLPRLVRALGEAPRQTRNHDEASSAPSEQAGDEQADSAP
jgi:Sec-independent protein translocase protein TatA